MQKLDNSANNFERGQVDTFMLKTKDVGDLKRVQVHAHTHIYCVRGDGRLYTHTLSSHDPACDLSGVRQ